MSKTFTYNDALRVTVGPMTRAQQLRLIAEPLDDITADTVPAIVQIEMLTDLLAVYCTRTIEGKDGKQWREVTDGLTVDDVTIGMPLTIAQYRELPVALTNQWGRAALECNPDLGAVLFLASTALLTTTGSGATSESAPSETPNEAA